MIRNRTQPGRRCRGRPAGSRKTHRSKPVVDYSAGDVRTLLRRRAILTVPETAGILGISPRKAWDLVKLPKKHPNHIPTVVLGEKTIRVKASFLRQLVGEKG